MMQEVFDKLRTLQGILSDRYDIEREIIEIPRTLTTKTELLNRMRKQYIEKNEQVEDQRGPSCTPVQLLTCWPCFILAALLAGRSLFTGRYSRQYLLLQLV